MRRLRDVLGLVLAGLAAILLQTTLFHLVPWGPWVPDLVLVLCVYLGLREHSVAGACAAFLLGYALDSFSGSVLGLNALIMTLVFLLVYLSSRRLWVENILTGVLLVLLAGLLKAVLMVGFLALAAGGAPGLLPGLFFSPVVEAVLGALLTPAVFGLLDALRRAGGEEDEAGIDWGRG